MKNIKPTDSSPLLIFIKGFGAGILGLSIFYYLLLFLVTKDPQHPFTQFSLFQPWMSLLILGFGVQVGLYWLLRKGFRLSLQEKQDAVLAAGTGTAVSGMAMVACCAHHLVEILPILGLSAAALFLSEYQQELLLFGVFANVVGIMIMLWLITGKASFKTVINYLFFKNRRFE